MSKWKKVTYLLIYKKRFYGENVGFTKLIKVLKLDKNEFFYCRL